MIKLKNLVYIHKHSGFTFNYLSRKDRFSARYITITDQEFKWLNFELINQWDTLKPVGETKQTIKLHPRDDLSSPEPSLDMI